MSIKYISITSLASERLGSQMNNFAMLFLIAQKTGHVVGIYDNYHNKEQGQALITEAFNIPVKIIASDSLQEASLLHWDTTSNLNLPKQDNLFELNSDLNYNICKGLIHFNFLYFLNTKNLNYLKQKIFIFKENCIKDSEYYFNSIKVQNKKIISIHVRRTDHCTLSTEFQKEAIKLFNPKEYKVLMFSDDINFCKEDFADCLNDYEVAYSNNTSVIDIRLMTLCDVNIIADSTFSFWGALLNKSEREMIIPRSILPSSMNLEEVLTPIKKFRSLKW